MKLSEYLIEAVAHGKAPKNRYGKKITEKDIREGILNQLYVDVTGDLDNSSEYDIVTSLSRMTNGDCLWAEFVDEDTGSIVHYLSGKNDNKVGKLVYDTDGYPVEGTVYSVAGGKMLNFVSTKLDDAIKYFNKWIYDTPW